LLKPYLYKNLTEAGVDEAGRGCLAGPVVAAAVILPKRFSHPVLTDSKQLSLKQRLATRDDILKSALAWKVAFISSTEIDEMNILRATWKAMHNALSGLTPQPQFIIVDGNRFLPFAGLPFKTIVRGDSLFYSIAAASVLAKTARDEYMEALHNEFPEYGWNQNKGYGTAAHRSAIERYGITPHHRRSFTLTNSQLTIDF
jgi:ribonuclease HII